MSETLDGFLEYLRVDQGRSGATLERYRGYLTRFLREVGDLAVVAIDGERLSLYKRRLLDAGLAPATMGAMLSCIRSFLRYLQNVRDLSVYDPDKIKRPKIPRRAVEYLTKEEVRRFLAAIPTHTLIGLRDRALAEVLCATGMRISEALSLNRSEIDWEAAEAKVIGKGNKQRKIYFNDAALSWLQEYLAYRHDDDAALFVTEGPAPTRLSAKGTWKRFRRYGKLAGFGKRVYPHMLRHTMATTLLANGCPIGHIRVLLGHTHLATSCRYYLGMMSDAEAKAAHAKYLSYNAAAVDETDGGATGRENAVPEELTRRAA